MTCPACGKETRGEWVDFGIGAYEYWGAPGVDVRMDYVSSCCEASLPEPPSPDKFDYYADDDPPF